jgi:myosin heavy subunit
MRSQLKSYQLLAAARIYRQGYPEHFNYEEFDRRFALFLPSPSSSSSVELSSSLLRTSLSGDAHKQACVQILKALEIDSSLWKLGSTQLFFKAGVLARCEEQRDERLENVIVRLQAHARRFIAQKSFDKKKVRNLKIKAEILLAKKLKFSIFFLLFKLTKFFVYIDFLKFFIYWLFHA